MLLPGKLIDDYLLILYFRFYSRNKLFGNYMLINRSYDLQIVSKNIPQEFILGISNGGDGSTPLCLVCCVLWITGLYHFPVCCISSLIITLQ